MLYTVEPGDTLSRITEKFYGSRVFWRLIIDANPDVVVLMPGIKMLIPLQCHFG
jgi:nucleoid-associated protein YgaU